jgi:CHAT domain-containing protein/Tfp pilus assembly protein PilF
MKSNNFWCRSVAWISTHVLYGILFFGFALSSWPVEAEATNSPVETLDQIQALRKAGKSSEALRLAQRWIVTNETLYGSESPNAAKPLACLANVYTDMGEYAKAEPLYQRSLKITEKALGPDHPDTVISLNNLAELYTLKGDYLNAELLYQRSLKTTENMVGPEHPDTASALDNLAGLYKSMGENTKAKPLLERSLTITEKALGPDHPDTVISLNNLAGLYKNMGEYAKAEPLYQRSLKITEKALGPDHPDTVISLNNLAGLYKSMCEYAKAEPLYQRSLKITEKALGPDHPERAKASIALADLYQIIGDYAKAESLYQRSLKIMEKVLGADHPDTASLQNKLGGLYLVLGEYAMAEPLFDQALTTRRKKLGPDNSETAAVLNNLALVSENMGEYSKAEQLLIQTLNIIERSLGPEHPETAMVLNNQAQLFMRIGEYAKAKPLYQRSLKIRESTLGPNHPDTALLNQDISLLQSALGEQSMALISARKAKATNEKTLSSILSFTSERQRMAYQVNQSPYTLFGTLGCALDLAEVLLRNKGVVLNSVIEDQLAAEASKDPAIRNSIDQLRVAGRRLIQLQMASPTDISEEVQKRQDKVREDLENEVDGLQKKLAPNISGIALTRHALRVTVPQVQAVLPKDGILMEFVRYDHYLEKNQFERRYGVVLIGEPRTEFENAKIGEPVWISLGSAKTIEQNIKSYNTAMHSGRKGEETILQTLYTELFDPIQKRLPKGIDTLIISPDAELNFLSFATLLDDQNKFLAERYTIKYVASGRDLLFGAKAKKENRHMVAVANPAFEEKPVVGGVHEANSFQLGMLITDQRDYSGLRLAPLVNTMQEAEFMREKSSAWDMDGVIYTGAEATETQIKAVKSPYILHIATHGFFLPDTTPTNQDRNLQLNDKMPMVWHNPMQRSGLALAGAQLTLDAWKRGEIPDTENDGILMAQEVSMMDLQNTWLVVLSACDTGVGEARAGEGVLGLRRGFIQAGAQNLMMTLWPVSDSWTVEMMKAFYERAMKTKDAPGALASVQREFLQKLRQEKNPIIAARLAGPFVMTFQGNPINN